MSTDMVTAGVMRVGDRQRERTAARLGQALEQGYLAIAEYDARMGEVYAARTDAALDGLVADLPVERIRRNDPRRRGARRRAARSGFRIHLTAYLAASVLMVVIWLATGGGYFWPVWPVVGWGVGVVSHAVSVSACTAHPRPARRGPYWR